MGNEAFSILQYWDQETIPDYIAGLVESFALHNPDFSHTLLSESSAEELIATHFDERHVACFRACAVPAMQADYLRYCALLALGGIYADADSRCVGSLRPLIHEQPGPRLFTSGGTVRVNGAKTSQILNGLLVFPQPWHPLLELTLSIATEAIERRVAETLTGPDTRRGAGVWLTTGPGIITGMRLAYELGSLEAFLDTVAGMNGEPVARLFCEVIGCYEALEEGFRGVQISPLSECSVVRDPGFELPYKRTEVHWTNVESSIYR